MCFNDVTSMPCVSVLVMLTVLYALVLALICVEILVFVRVLILALVFVEIRVFVRVVRVLICSLTMLTCVCSKSCACLFCAYNAYEACEVYKAHLSD